MATVVLHAVVSVDGFIAGPDDDPGPLFDWYFNGDQPLTDETGERQHARFRVSAASAGYTRAFWDSIGATVMGRHLFDLVAVCAGEVGGQALQLGLVDEVAMDVVPVVMGEGRKYFGGLTGQHLLDDPSVVIPGDRVLHLRYPVRR
jgi:dihydrofolate reductase